MWLELALLVVTAFLLTYWKITRQFNFFKDLGIPHIKPSFPFGNNSLKKLVTAKIKFIELDATVVEEGPKDAKIFGYFIFGQPNFMVNDIELAKRILIKDFEHFTDRRTAESDDKILSAFLTSLTGETWKQVRSMVSGVFTSGKLKLMTRHIVKVGDNFERFIGDNAKNDKETDLKEACGFMTLDAIATAVFGIESSSMEDPENTFRIMALRLVSAPGYRQNFIKTALKSLILFTMPKVARFFRISALNQQVKNFFVDIIKKAYTQRLQNGTRRNDMIDLLTDELKESKKTNDNKPNSFESDFEQDAALDMSKVKNLDESELDKETLLISNALIFFFAGFDTTSFGLAQCFHCLAVHPEHQDKVYQEISDVLEDDTDITFEKIQSLKYLDMVIAESFRISKNIIGLERQCSKDYKVPDTDIIIPKGRVVKIFTQRFSIDPDNFKNPTEFDPDNFLPENNYNKYGYSPFGHGPRNCIGMRYALLTIKIALVSVLRSYKIVRCEKTGDELTLNIQTGKLDGGIVKAVLR